MKLLIIILVLSLLSCSEQDRAAVPDLESVIVSEDVTPVPRLGPARVRIVPDDYHTKWVGRTDDGLQFFITTPFVAATGDKPGQEFVAVFVWNADGGFKEARLTDLGARVAVTADIVEAVMGQQLKRLGNYKTTSIDVAPCQVEQWGITFGLVYSEFEGSEWVELSPGNYIAFTPPWEGDYDT